MPGTGVKNSSPLTGRVEEGVIVLGIALLWNFPPLPSPLPPGEGEQPESQILDGLREAKSQKKVFILTSDL